MAATSDTDIATDAVFEAERRRLVGLAYRITGSLGDAEDIVQEAWLRLRRADPATVERPAAWLTTVVSRLALDHLKAARHQREVYVGPWLPEPVVASPLLSAGPGPEEMAEMAQSLTMGFLHLLEQLSPTERVVFILADVFDVPYREIAESVGKTEAACRQIASRARRRVREAAPPAYEPPNDEAARTVGEMLAAVMAGDIDHLVGLLAEDAVLVSDGGANFRAARHPILGPERIARFMAKLSRRMADATIVPVSVNGEYGLVAERNGRAYFAVAIHVEDGRVRTVHIIRNEEKLAGLHREVDLI
jgi:RNA polymerase sigma-70 factor (ECF subfamily)